MEGFMFKVIEKHTGRIYNVYDVKYDKCGYPQLVIYKNGQWQIKSAKYFVPNER